MGAHYALFIRPSVDCRSIVSEVEHAVGAPLLPHFGERDLTAIYAGIVVRTQVQLALSHRFEEDHGMRFESYPVLVDFRDIDRIGTREEQVGRALFGRLRAAGHALLLTFDLQLEIDRFDP